MFSVSNIKDVISLSLMKFFHLFFWLGRMHAISRLKISNWFKEFKLEDMRLRNYLKVGVSAISFSTRETAKKGLLLECLPCSKNKTGFVSLSK